MGTAPILGQDWENIGIPLYLGQDCPTCGYIHPCDAICLRFSPKIFYCPCCKVMKKHRPMPGLLRAYQASRLMKGLTTP